MDRWLRRARPPDGGAVPEPPWTAVAFRNGTEEAQCVARAINFFSSIKRDWNTGAMPRAKAVIQAWTSDKRKHLVWLHSKKRRELPSVLCDGVACERCNKLFLRTKKKTYFSTLKNILRVSHLVAK